MGGIFLRIYVYAFLTSLVAAKSAISNTALRSSLESTCPSRTVNYITHTLPQQCLATSRASVSLDTAESLTSVSSPTTNAFSTAPIIPGSDTATIPLSATNSPVNTPVPGDSSSTTSSQDQKTSSERNNLESETADEDSELESSNFLSFEEWKKQNLKKAGQPEHIGRRSPNDAQEPRQRPINIQNSLESLGEEGEIDIDFSGFVPAVSDLTLEATNPLSDSIVQKADQHDDDKPKLKKRNKDAGTTCKERFNYASFDCAANLLKYNKGAKNPNAVLLENKDSYMLNQCTIQDKFIILELCDDILIDTVVLANYEFFSSTFRTFRVSVSDRWPVKNDKWRTLGTYEAHNSRQVQAFLVENPLIWARYVRIEFLTHYGNEYYCPLSLVRVHGITMIEEWKSGEEVSFDNENENENENENDEIEQSQVDDHTVDATFSTISVQLPISTYTKESQISVNMHKGKALLPAEISTEVSISPTEPYVPASVIAMEAIMSVIESPDTCFSTDKPSRAGVVDNESTSTTSPSKEPSPARSSRTPQTTKDPIPQDSQTPAVSSIISSSPASAAVSASSMSTVVPTSVQMDVLSESQLAASKSALEKDFIVSSTSVIKLKSNTNTAAEQRPKSSSSSTSASPATPSTQESFFKSVQKRLQMLETNSSLSLQYIEDQSRSLREAFRKVEQRQLSRTNNFLDTLNHTVLRELRDFRQQYDQLWQSTVIELDVQRERYQRDNEAIHARISILADEVIFQRRMAVLQMVLILICLALVLFSRGAINNYLELPLVKDVLSKSPSSRWLNLSTDAVDRPSPLRTRSVQTLRSERTGILKSHRRMQSEDSVTDTQSGNELYAPTTPISDYGQSEVELSRHDDKSPIDSEADVNVFDDPHFDPSMIERPSTSPPILIIDDTNLVRADGETPVEQSIDERLLGQEENLSELHNIGGVALPEAIATSKKLSWNLPDG